MKFKGTLILLLLLGIVGSFAYFYEYKGGARREETEKASKRLIGLDKAKVKEVRLEYPDKTIVGVREGEGRWKITAPIATAADGSEWDKLVTNLADLEKEKVLEESPADLKPFGLDSPVLKVSVALEGGALVQIFFGFPNPTGSLIYAKVPNKKEVVLVPNTTYQGVKKDLLDLRERSLVKFNEFNTVDLQLTNSHGAFTLERVDRAWQIKAPVSARAEASEVSSILNTLSFTKVSDFVDYNPPTESEMGLDRPRIDVSFTERKEGEGAGASAVSRHRFVIGASRKGGGSELYYARDPDRKDILLVDRQVVDKLDRALFDLRVKEIASFQRFEVDGMDINSGKESLVLRKDKSQWYLGPAPAVKDAGGDGKAPADPRPKVKSDKVVAMFNALESYKVTEFIDRSAGLSVYGLEKPRLEVVLWKGEDRLAQLLFGNDARPSAKQAGGQRFVYLSVKGEPYVKIVNKEVFDSFKVLRSDLLETEPKP